MSRIFVLHENSAWVEPLFAAFKQFHLPYEDWFLDESMVALDREPPEGVFYNRLSASSHTRGHRYAPELADVLLKWLEKYGRRVVNSSRALALEVSKITQYATLNRAGVLTPRTIAAVGHDKVLEAVEALGGGPYILKPNRGGRGVGVSLFESKRAIADYLDKVSDDERPIDGVWLIQEYIRSPEPFITRCEFIGGRFHYAVRVDTSDGFELCPADVCQIGETLPQKFTIDRKFDHPILNNYLAFLTANEIEIAGIEFIRDESGTLFTYDVNTNTNYNARAEKDAQVPVTGMEAIACFLGEELAALR